MQLVQYIHSRSQGKYKQAKEAYEQFESQEGNEPQVKATALKQLGKSSLFSQYSFIYCYCSS